MLYAQAGGERHTRGESSMIHAQAEVTLHILVLGGEMRTRGGGGDYTERTYRTYAKRTSR